MESVIADGTTGANLTRMVRTGPDAARTSQVGTGRGIVRRAKVPASREATAEQRTGNRRKRLLPAPASEATGVNACCSRGALRQQAFTPVARTWLDAGLAPGSLRCRREPAAAARKSPAWRSPRGTQRRVRLGQLRSQGLQTLLAESILLVRKSATTRKPPRRPELTQLGWMPPCADAFLKAAS